MDDAPAASQAHEPAVAGTFYFDLASPLAYLAAERASSTFARAAVEWQPVLAAGLPGGETFAAFRCAEEEAIFRTQVELRASELGLPEVRWPRPFPFDSSLAMRVATFAKSIGRTVPFAQAAFRQAFAGGHSLEDENFVLIAAAACEMHPSAVLRASELRSVAAQLEQATAAAAQAGVAGVPAVRIGAGVFTGERELERAAQELGPR